jgi:hypothetical protein
MEFALTVALTPVVLISILLGLSMRDWAKADTPTNSMLRRRLGWFLLIALWIEWLLPLIMVLVLYSVGLGADLHPFLSVVVLGFVVVTTVACYFTLEGSARVEAIIAGIVLLITLSAATVLLFGHLDWT